MDVPANIPSGIPVVVAGIPTSQDEHGIVSPFPWANADSEEWKGVDEEGGFDTDGGVGVRTPHPDDDNDGGDEVDPEDDEDEDIDDDMGDTGFGIGLMLSTFFKPQVPLLPA